jgi:hypothetical protein
MRHAFTSRQYAGEDDLLQMQGLLMDARSRTDDWRYWHIGDLMWAFFLLERHLEPRDHIRLWHDERGVLAGRYCPTMPGQASRSRPSPGLKRAGPNWRSVTSYAGVARLCGEPDTTIRKGSPFWNNTDSAGANTSR